MGLQVVLSARPDLPRHGGVREERQEPRAGHQAELGLRAGSDLDGQPILRDESVQALHQVLQASAEHRLGGATRARWPRERLLLSECL